MTAEVTQRTQALKLQIQEELQTDLQKGIEGLVRKWMILLIVNSVLFGSNVYMLYRISQKLDTVQGIVILRSPSGQVSSPYRERRP
jgi:hypothetical protein